MTPCQTRKDEEDSRGEQANADQDIVCCRFKPLPRIQEQVHCWLSAGQVSTEPQNEPAASQKFARSNKQAAIRSSFGDVSVADPHAAGRSSSHCIKCLGPVVGQVGAEKF